MLLPEIRQNRSQQHCGDTVRSAYSDHAVNMTITILQSFDRVSRYGFHRLYGREQVERGMGRQEHPFLSIEKLCAEAALQRTDAASNGGNAYHERSGRSGDGMAAGDL